MAEFFKPSDVSFPVELLRESELLYEDKPVLETLRVLSAIHRRIWKW